MSISCLAGIPCRAPGSCTGPPMVASTGHGLPSRLRPARRTAVEAAARQAQQLADAAGIVLSAIRGIIESGAGPAGFAHAGRRRATALTSAPVEPGIVDLSVRSR